MSRRVGRLGCVFLYALVAGPLAEADPVTRYRQACEAPYFDHLATVTHPNREAEEALFKAAISVSDTTCSAFVAHLAAIPDPTPQMRLALLLARRWLGDYAEETHCDEVRAIAEELEDDAEALHELAQCYLDLSSSETPPCQPNDALGRLGEQRLKGGTYASPEDPVEIILLR